MDFRILNNTRLNRFEIELSGEVAYLEYKLSADLLILIHTFTPLPMRGKGVASALAKFALEYAIQNKLKVAVYCLFIKEYLKAHPEYKTKLEIITAK